MADQCCALICSLVLIVTMVSAMKDMTHFNTIIQSSYYSDNYFYTFDWLSKVSLKQCVDACKLTKACEYINFETRCHRCELVRAKPVGTVEKETEIIQTKTGSILGKKAEWIQDNAKNCETCPSTGNCGDTTGIKNNKCRNSGCELPLNTRVKGNMLSSDNKLIQHCELGSTKFPLNTSHWKNQSVCLTNGTWTPNTICVEGEVLVRNGLYYYFNNNNLSRDTAQSFCETLFGHLVKIENQAEQDFISSLLVGEFDVITWIGLKYMASEDLFRWTDGTIVNYNNWIPTQPQISLGNCTKIMHSLMSHGWASSRCTTGRPSICKFQ